MVYGFTFTLIATTNLMLTVWKRKIRSVYWDFISLLPHLWCTWFVNVKITGSPFSLDKPEKLLDVHYVDSYFFWYLCKSSATNVSSVWSIQCLCLTVVRSSLAWALFSWILSDDWQLFVGLPCCSPWIFLFFVKIPKSKSWLGTILQERQERGSYGW